MEHIGTNKEGKLGQSANSGSPGKQLSKWHVGVHKIFSDGE